jgi:hypothetical protein
MIPPINLSIKGLTKVPRMKITTGAFPLEIEAMELYNESI